MRGVLGLASIIVGGSMAWLIIIGKFPPNHGGNATGTGLLAVLKTLQNQAATSTSNAPGSGLAGVGQAGQGAVKGS